MRSVKNSNETFWVTNFSKKIVSLSDLGISIQPYRSVNLLDPKRYYLTKEQLTASATSGSLKVKSSMISIRKVPPYEQIPQPIPQDDNPEFPSRIRSGIESKVQHFNELDISDEKYATDNADFAAADHLGKWNKR